MPIDHKTIHNLSASVASPLAEGRIAEALANLEAFAGAASSPFNTRERITALADSYAMLSRFLIDGVSDPHREEIAADIAAEASAINAAIERDALAACDDPSLYMSTLRFERTRPEESIAALIKAYAEASATPDIPLATTESMAQRIFNRLWVTCPLTASDAEAVHAAVASATTRIPDHARILLIGSLMLGALRFFDQRRAVILADTYRINNSTPLGAVALAALVLVLAAAPVHASGHRKLRAALDALSDVPTVAADTRMAFMQLIRSRDTERVSRKLTDDLLPGIMKLRPDIDRRMRDLDKNEAAPFDESGELNPEWEDMFEKSGLGDKLRELNELQSEGADVMMATMGGLKDFSFFNDPANWFLPFYASHSAASGSGVAQLSGAIEGLPMMCDGDKYSLVLFAARMGGNLMGAGLSAHLDEQERQWRELRRTDIDGDAKACADAANSFVQNVYRFFKLFRRKNEFVDPFVKPINPLSTPLLSQHLGSDAEALSIAAEFYFRRGHYSEALQLFNRIEELTPPSAELYQKKGYVLEMTGTPDDALEAYHTADLIDSDSVWTLRRIAALLVRTGRHSDALSFFDRIEAIKPDRRTDIMARARCLMELKRHTDALAQLYKSDFLKPDRPDTLRLMVRCQLIVGDAAKARASADRLKTIAVGSATDPYDNILLGLACMALGDLRGAVAAYTDFISGSDFDTAPFIAAMRAERPVMERIGASPLTINIITEAALTESSRRGSSINK